MVTRRQILAVTLHQPTPSLLLAGTLSGVERERPPEGLEVGDFLAIHAGRTVDLGAWRKAHEAARQAGTLERVPWLAALAPPLARADRIATQRMREHATRACPYGAVVGVMALAGVESVAGGMFLWRLVHPVALAPVACFGQRGLWPLPPEVYRTIRTAYGVATRRTV